MQIKLDWVWESLDAETARAKVIGGWLIRSRNKQNEALLFLPDRDFGWTIRPPVDEVQAAKVSLAKDFA